jgi:diadenosine tetraphosphate (Ap4A) HIT family hydrolase
VLKHYPSWFHIIDQSYIELMLYEDQTLPDPILIKRFLDLFQAQPTHTILILQFHEKRLQLLGATSEQNLDVFDQSRVDGPCFH